MKRILFWSVPAVAVLGMLALLLARPRPVAAERSAPGRVGTLTGDLLVKGPGDADWSYLDRNGVVGQGDVLWADQKSSAEVEIERGAWMRLGPDTRVDVRHLPPSGDLRLERGSLYVDLAEGVPQEVLVRIPCGDVRAQGGSLVRVDLAQGDQGRVLVRRGTALLQPHSGGEQRLAAGDIATFAPPECRAALARLSTDQLDAFDRWSDSRVQFFQSRTTAPRPYVRITPAGARAAGTRERVAGYRGEVRGSVGYREAGGGSVRRDYARGAEPYRDRSSQTIAYYDSGLPNGVDRYLPGVYDLDQYGDWVDYQGTSCWRPTYVSDDWRPYHDGYWGTWNDQPYWVDDEPWGYTTCHYGRWNWVNDYGWLWYPGSQWGPGWVDWTTAGDWVGWGPLNPWGQPVVRSRPFSVGNLLVDSLVWSFMQRSNFARRDRDLILALDRAPIIPVRQAVLIRDPATMVQGLPRTALVRGRLETPWATVPAVREARLLARQPLAAGFGVRAVDPFRARSITAARGERLLPLGTGARVAARSVIAPAIRMQRAQILPPTVMNRGAAMAAARQPGRAGAFSPSMAAGRPGAAPLRAGMAGRLARQRQMAMRPAATARPGTATASRARQAAIAGAAGQRGAPAARAARMASRTPPRQQRAVASSRFQQRAGRPAPRVSRPARFASRPARIATPRARMAARPTAARARARSFQRTRVATRPAFRQQSRFRSQARAYSQPRAFTRSRVVARPRAPERSFTRAPRARSFTSAPRERAVFAPRHEGGGHGGGGFSGGGHGGGGHAGGGGGERGGGGHGGGGGGGHGGGGGGGGGERHGGGGGGGHHGH